MIKGNPEAAISSLLNVRKAFKRKVKERLVEALILKQGLITI
jgi:hypothetical protein